MTTIANLQATIGADVGPLHSALGDAKGETSGFGSFMQNALSFSVGQAIVGGIQAIGGAIKDVAGGFVKALGDMATEAMNAEDNMVRLDAVLKSTSSAFGPAADKTVFVATGINAVGKAASLTVAEQKALNKEIANAPEKLDRARASLADLQATQAKGKGLSNTQQVNMKYLAQDIAGYESLLAKTGDTAAAAAPKVEGYWKKIAGPIQISKQAVLDIADALSLTTRYEDDTILAGENMLLTFTSIGKDVFPAATEAMLNISTAMGTDLKSSALQLGKALNDPVDGMAALKRVGVQFTDEQVRMVKSLVASGRTMDAQKLILKELEVEFGGVAVAAGTTAAGKLDILKNKFGNIKETIGAAVLPALKRFADFGGQVLSGLANSGLIQKFADALGQMADAAGKFFEQTYEKVKSGVVAWDSFWKIVKDFGLLKAIDFAKFYLGLSDEQAAQLKLFAGAITDVVTAINGGETSFANLERFLGSISAQIDAVVKSAPAALEQLGIAIAGAIDKLFGNTGGEKSAGQAGANIIPSMAAAMGQADVSPMEKAFDRIITKIGGKMEEWDKILTPAITHFTQTVGDAIVAGFDAWRQREFANGFFPWMADRLGITGGSQKFYDDLLKQQNPAGKTAQLGAISNGLQGQLTTPDPFTAAGQAIANNIATSLVPTAAQQAPALAAMTNLAQGQIDAYKQAWGIKSPSTVAAAMSADILAGLGVGFVGSLGILTDGFVQIKGAFTTLIADIHYQFLTTNWSDVGYGIDTAVASSIRNNQGAVAGALNEVIQKAIEQALAGVGVNWGEQKRVMR